MSDVGAPLAGPIQKSRTWQRLGAFWAVVGLTLGAGAATLQWLGPMPGPGQMQASAAGAPAHGMAETEEGHKPPAAEAAHVEVAAHGGIAPLPTLTTTSLSEPIRPPPVPGPEAALLEPSRAAAPAQVPRIAADGRQSRIVYAAPSPPVPAGSARIAVLISGFGLSERDSRVAIEQLPAAVSFAVSAYAQTPSILVAAREAGHELLASIPMEPQGYPLNDEGSQSLMTGRSPVENSASLEWALSRTPGVVGATGASDGMRGERYAELSALYDPMVAEITRRGLLYVDARPGRAAAPGTAVRAIDLVLDDQPGRADLDARLQSLERTARERGAAIGLVGLLRPAILERLVAWSKGLGERGLVLVPVSTVVNPDLKQASKP